MEASQSACQRRVSGIIRETQRIRDDCVSLAGLQIPLSNRPRFPAEQQRLEGARSSEILNALIPQTHNFAFQVTLGCGDFDECLIAARSSQRNLHL